MMSELSNKTVVLLLILAIALSVGGAWLSLSKTGKVTGMATGAGNVTLTITSQTSINLTVRNIDFGSGYVTPGCNNCTMKTPSITDAICCSGLSAPSSGLIVENTGNTNCSLNVTTTDGSETFIGGTNPEFSYNLSAKEIGSCADWGSNINDTWNLMSAAENVGVCRIFTPENNKDEIKMDIGVRVPDNAFLGPRNTTFTFIATEWVS